jgi:hypothetical protein
MGLERIRFHFPGLDSSDAILKLAQQGAFDKIVRGRTHKAILSPQRLANLAALAPSRHNRSHEEAAERGLTGPRDFEFGLCTGESTMNAIDKNIGKVPVP